MRQTEDKTSLVGLFADEREMTKEKKLVLIASILISPNINTTQHLCSLTVKKGTPSSPQMTTLLVGEVFEEVGQRWVATVTRRVPVDSRVHKRTLTHRCFTFLVQRFQRSDTENRAESVLREAICLICNFYPGIFSPGRGAFGRLFSSMTSLRALLPLLLWLGPLVVGEVSQDFSKCLEFFYKRTPPTGFGKPGCKYICQRYRNLYHFASLYDQPRRIPIYSAYKLNHAPGKRPRVWKYEPQVFK